LDLEESRLAYRAQSDALADQNLVPVKEIDLEYGMGGTFLDTPVTEKISYFPLDWIRLFTNAKPEDLVFTRGVGDSMEPTIGNHDVILIDLSDRTVRMSDKFWALAIGQVGMIKRLRPLGEALHVLSDNPTVSDFTAVDEEVVIVGRVVCWTKKG